MFHKREGSVLGSYDTTAWSLDGWLPCQTYWKVCHLSPIWDLKCCHCILILFNPSLHLYSKTFTICLPSSRSLDPVHVISICLPWHSIFQRIEHQVHFTHYWSLFWGTYHIMYKQELYHSHSFIHEH